MSVEHYNAGVEAAAATVEMAAAAIAVLPREHPKVSGQSAAMVFEIANVIRELKIGKAPTADLAATPEPVDPRPPLPAAGQALTHAVVSEALIVTSIAEQRSVARAKGYTGEVCQDCGCFTMTRNGTCLKCDTCGATTGCS